MSAEDWPIVAIVPVLERPWRAAPLVESFQAATPYGRVVFVCSSTDRAELDACRATGVQVVTVPGPRRHADYAVKIQAGYRETSEPLILLGADDLVFHPGWHDAVAAAADEDFGVIGTQDLGNRHVLAGQHSTHAVVARWYADEYGTVDGPGRVLSDHYDHQWVDNELVETAKHRRMWTFCTGAVVEHKHPNWAKAEDDPVYRLGRLNFDNDRATFNRRRALWT